MLFDRILFATDFSGTSARALDYVRRLKDAGCTQVVLLHVIDEREVNVVLSQPSAFINTEGEYEAELLRFRRKNAQSEMNDIRLSLEDAGLRVTPYIIDGIPSIEIVRIADAEQASLIVVGSHGRSNISRMLLGSVSENVIRHAQQPVLVVRRSDGE
ncbi:MAG: universal stress protein [Methanomicrobiaceae archaeon]|nr:universal stress protein [Methanomicrobiaceae archaeon]